MADGLAHCVEKVGDTQKNPNNQTTNHQHKDSKITLKSKEVLITAANNSTDNIKVNGKAIKTRNLI